MQFDTMKLIVSANIQSVAAGTPLGPDVSDALIGAYINEGYNKVNSMMQWPWLFKEGSDTLTVSDQTLSVPADTGQIVAAYNQTLGQRLQFMDYRQGWVDQPEATVSEGRATHYYRIGDSWYVWPDPTNADVILIKYVRTISDLSGTNEPDGWPSAFHHILVDYATWKYLSRTMAVNPQYANTAAAAAERFYQDFMHGLQLMQASYLTDEIGDIVAEDELLRHVYAEEW